MIEQLKKQPPFLQLVTIAALGFVTYFIVSMLIFSIVPQYLGFNTTADIQRMETEHGALFMVLFYLPMQISLFLVPGIIFSKLYKQQEIFTPEHNLGDRYGWLLWSVALFLGMFMLLPALTELNVYLTQLTGTYDGLMESKLLADERLYHLFGPETPTINYITALLIIALATGLCEEFAFRRFLLGHLLKTTGNSWLSIITSALFFAILHFNYVQVLPLIGFGLALGLVYYTTQSIWPGVALHALNNAISITWVHQDAFPKWMIEQNYKITIPTLILMSGLILWKRKRLIFRK